MSNTTILDLVHDTASASGASQVATRAVIREFMNLVVANVSNGRACEIRGGMTFYRGYRKGRPVRDIRRGESLWMNGKYVMLARFPRGYL